MQETRVLTSVVEILTERGKLADDFLLKMLSLGASDELYRLAKHQVVAGGKRVRSSMTILCCEAVGGDVEVAIPGAAGVELIHNYTLIFDDVIDQADLRRGYPTIRAVYSDVMAFLAGMHYREAIFESARRSPKPMVVQEIFSSTLRRIIEGERLDILYEQAGRESDYIKKTMFRQVAMADYFKMVEAKTAVLFEASCKIGGLVGDGSTSQVEALSRFGSNCGMAFQIRDDILDIVGITKELGKEAGKDIKEHKLGNIVLLYSLEELPDSAKTKLLNILRTQLVTNTNVEIAVKTILSTNAVKRAYNKSEDFIKAAKSSIQSLPPSDAKKRLLTLADFVTERKF